MTNGQDLGGAVALVTGAAGALGASICSALERNGAIVVRADLKPGAGLHRLDVTDGESWDTLITEIGTTHGRLDILVNNAGIAPMERIESFSIETWRRTMAVNVEGVALGLRAATTLLRTSGALRRGGASVINIASAAANRPSAFGAGYCTSKAAVAMLSKVAAIEFSLFGYPIRVNSVHPGAVRSPMIDDILQTFSALNGGVPPEDLLKAMIATYPMKRLVEPEEVAAAVQYLASDAASFVHGSEQHVDGGYIAA